MRPAVDEIVLLERLKSGDEQAFAQIYNTYSPSLINYASALLSLEEARDIIHDLFVYLWEERADIEITSSLGAFFFAAIRYRMIDRIRHAQVLRKYEKNVISSSTEQVSDIGPRLEAKELKNIMENHVNELSPRVREVYKMSRDENLTIREISQRLGRSEQTIKNQLSTAIAQLRVLIDKSVGLIILLLLQ